MDGALLVIDMQNGFCHPDGFVAAAGARPAAMDAVIRETGALLAAAREAGVPVLHARYTLRPDHADASPRMRRALAGTPGELARGSWSNAILDEVAPAPREPVIDKRVFDAFLRTGLEDGLRARGARRLLVAGVFANLCVESTVRTAEQLGFDTLLATDCTAAFPEERLSPALDAMGQLFAGLGPWREQLAALTAGHPAPA